MSPRSEERRDPDSSGLLEEIRSGVPGAWERLIDRFGPMVLAVARAAGLGREDAREVFQDTWASLHRQIHAIRGAPALSSWIHTTARRRTRRLVRRNRREPSRPGAKVPNPPDRHPDPLESVVELERRLALREGLGALSLRCRRLLEALFLADGPSDYAEASRRTQIPVSSIGPTRRRCLARLAAILERSGFR